MIRAGPIILHYRAIILQSRVMGVDWDAFWWRQAREAVWGQASGVLFLTKHVAGFLGTLFGVFVFLQAREVGIRPPAFCSGITYSQNSGKPNFEKLKWLAGWANQLAIHFWGISLVLVYDWI